MGLCTFDLALLSGVSWVGVGLSLSWVSLVG